MDADQRDPDVITVVLADDDQVVRSGLRMLLDAGDPAYPRRHAGHGDRRADGAEFAREA